MPIACGKRMVTLLQQTGGNDCIKYYLRTRIHLTFLSFDVASHDAVRCYNFFDAVEVNNISNFLCEVYSLKSTTYILQESVIFTCVA